MSSWPLVKYVDSPSTSATVRYDFNDQNPVAGSPIKKVTAFDPGVPTLEGDPDAVGQQWGFRSPSITHTIKGTKAQAMAALSAVSKEQLRRTNWLLFQPSASKQPVWFKTYRAGYQPITLDQVWVRPDGGGEVLLADTWKITVPLVADAFTYGARVSIPTAQVVQSPADLTGPTRTAMHVVLPAIKGDAPTPLRVTITPNNASGLALPSSAWLVGCSCGKTTMSDLVADVGTGDGLTAGTGTAAPTPDATFFGGSYRAITIAAASPNLIQRLSGNLPAAPSGRYRVLVRLEADALAGNSKPYLFQFGVIPTSSFAGPYYGPSKQLTVQQGAGTAFRGWVDVGDFTLPADLPMPRDITDVLPSPALAPAFSLKIGTPDGSAGTSPLRVDAIKLIPIDGPTVDSARILKATWSRFPPNAVGVDTYIGTFDGDSETFWLTYNGALYPSAQVMQGGYPIADPASARNLLTVMALDHGPLPAAGATVTSKDAQAAVDVSYHPRYLHIGDGT